MKAVVFNLGITVAELPERQINKDFVLLKPLRVLINGLENAIYVGLLWVEPWRILGSTGIGRVENVGLDIDKNLEGKLVLILPYSQSYGGIGTEIDGLLCEKAVIPFDSIVILPQSKFNEKYILYPYVSFAFQLVNQLNNGSTLIIGSGLYGIISALYLKDLVTKVSVYREDGINPKIIGVEEVKHISQEWDNIIITTFKSWIRAHIEDFVKNNTKVIMPKLMNSWPLISSNKITYIAPKEVDGVIEYINNKISDRLFQEVVSFSGDILTSFPATKAGVILKMDEIFK
ncbi:zinc-binding alcohol dehydrogenase family protein [Saccharolobus caldissimus]|uniref:Alcohol dehydrogenase n=1 Tax=Saccharolobus caldissimus TaxID=1702097 RepID=A0AAQ4CMI6_9CREN|nr:zinc-binding alcohol dehydrogenase family protein [Saccharolobus caldissimus]BDB97017.1 alcohol dehydrogenase [Saccharolobus caldissimus]